MEDDEMDFTSKRRDVKKGRRARALPEHTDGQPNGELPKEMEEMAVNNPADQEQGEVPPRPPRRQMGWANDNVQTNRTGDATVSGVDQFEDERLRPDSGKKASESDDDDIPVIPDLDDVQEEDMATQIAAPPLVQLNRVATFRELDNDLLKHSQLLTLDNEIDLKLLTRCLSSESEVKEDNRPWNWEHLFTEISSELQTEWDQLEKNQSDVAKT